MNVDTKIIGYGLLISGLLIILISGLNIYSILQGKAHAVSYFSFDPIEIPIDTLVGSESRTDLSLSPKIEIVSKQMLDDTSNLLAHIFLIGMLVTIGGKVSSIGVYLLRPVKVNLTKEKDAKV